MSAIRAIVGLLYQLSDTRNQKINKNLRSDSIETITTTTTTTEAPVRVCIQSTGCSVWCVRARQWMWYNCVSIALRHHHYSPTDRVIELGELWITHACWERPLHSSPISIVAACSCKAIRNSNSTACEWVLVFDFEYPKYTWTCADILCCDSSFRVPY